MKKILVNGTFDILHVGHVRMLEFAKSYPDSFVYVLVDGDQRVKDLKGSGRPINTEYERVSLLAALKSVDRVDIFNSDQELETLIQNFQPDIMVKGSDYCNKEIIGAKYCKHIVYYERLEKYSTTQKVQHISNR